MNTIFYVEDDHAIARLVKEYLEQNHCKVTIFQTIQEAEQGFKAKQPNLAMVDWNMPDGQGATLCHQLRSQYPELPIIILTVRSEAHDIISGFQSGADDYVVKPFNLAVLHSRILALLRRSGQAKPTYFQCDALALDTEKRAVFCKQEEIALSQLEYQVLLLLLQNKGKTVTRTRLLEQVWDSNGSFVNDNTLTVTIKRLREKLHHPTCLKTIRSFGYRMEDTI